MYSFNGSQCTNNFTRMLYVYISIDNSMFCSLLDLDAFACPEPKIFRLDLGGVIRLGWAALTVGGPMANIAQRAHSML